jgi:hypothetical protein
MRRLCCGGRRWLDFSALFLLLSRWSMFSFCLLTAEEVRTLIFWV